MHFHPGKWRFFRTKGAKHALRPDFCLFFRTKGAVSAVDGPQNGTSTAKMGVFEGDGPEYGTSTTPGRGKQGLLYIQQQPLKVLAFRVIDVHGVVCRLVEAVEYADRAAGFRGCGKHGKRKGFLVYNL